LAIVAGKTGISAPFCHWTRLNSPEGEPFALQDRLPSNVGHVPECRDFMIVALSILPVFFATASIS
jgi:hypothetical protein